MFSPEFYVASGLLLLISVLASKASGRIGVPALLVFLAIGMLAGDEGVGGIQFDNVELAQALGIIALSFILFSGGLDTKWDPIRSVMGRGIALSSVGVLLTSLLMGVFASAVLPGLSLLEGLLLGAIISSTDAAAVFSVLRSKGVRLKGNTKPLLELESGSNDPMAVFLTIGFLAILKENQFSWGLATQFVQQMSVGAVFGFIAGKSLAYAINRLNLEYEGLYPVLTIACVALTYGLTELGGGNGFLATYLAGLFLGKERFPHRRSLSQFHDGAAWLMQITMFLVLGLLVYPSKLMPLALSGLLLSAFLMFVARPLVVYLLLLRSEFDFRERSLIGWVGLKGAVPIILATYPFVAGVEQAEYIFNLVFFIVLTSIVVQGASLPWVSKWLDLEEESSHDSSPLHTSDLYATLDGELKQVVVHPESEAVGRNIAQLALPEGSLIALIQRSNKYIIPRGSTIIEGKDKLFLLLEHDQLTSIKSFLGKPPSKGGK